MQKPGFGAKLGGMPVGCIAYANDLTMISLTVKGLQTILDISEKFVHETSYGSTSKSVQFVCLENENS